MKGRETFSRRHTVPVTSCSEVKYVLKRVLALFKFLSSNDLYSHNLMLETGRYKLPKFQATKQRQYWGTGNIRKQNLREQRNKPIHFRGTRKHVPPPTDRASHITEATEYHQSNGIQYYWKFAIVIQAMMFKQMLVHKLFVVRRDASRFTATIYYSLFGGNVLIIGT